MSPVISKRTAREILAWFEDRADVIESGRVVRELRKAMEPKRSVKSSRLRRVAKKQTKKAARQDVRAAVMERAGLRCECCGDGGTIFNPLTLEHMFGRVRVPETVENCWALCLACHHRKTDNIPSAVFWFEAFAKKAEARGDHAAAATARRDGEWRQAKKDADEARRAASMTRGAP